MNLTQEQKKFIKKNYKKIPTSKIASELKIKEKDIQRYIYKKYGQLSSQDQSGVNPNISTLSYLKKKWHIFLFLIILVLSAYTNSINNAFVSDDIDGILKNPNIGNLSQIKNNPRDFLNVFIYFLLFKIGGLNPAIFRSYNIFLHLLSTFLVFLIIFKITKKENISFAVSSLFAVHPLLTEAVTWISGRPYTQYTFFLLLSFYTYLNSSRKKILFLISFFGYIFGLLSSEKAIIFPLIILAYEFFLGNIKTNWKKILSFFGVLFVGGLYFASKVPERIQAVISQSAGSAGGMLNPLTQVPIAISSYIESILWPSYLTLYRSEMTYTQTSYIVRLIATILIFLAIIYFYKKNRIIAFFISFFIISLLPTMTPFGISWIVAERYIYFGSIGIFFTICYFFFKAFEKHNLKNYTFIVLGIILIALTARTIFRNIDWKNEDNLWEATAKTSPSSQNTHNNMGDVYSRRGDFENAEKEFKKSIEINPRYAEAWHNLALTYQKVGKIEEAIQTYKKAISLKPELWQSYENLAVIYFNENNFKEAKKVILSLIKINPQNANYYVNLGIVEAKLGDQVAALTNLKKALLIDPKNKDAQKFLQEFSQNRQKNSATIKEASQEGEKSSK